MSIARKIRDNILWRGIFMVTLFAINLLMARVLGASGSGNFNLLINNLSFFILVAGLSLEASITYFAAGNEISAGKLVTISIGWPLIAGLLGLALSQYFFCSSSSGLPCAELKYWAAAFIFSTSLLSFFNGLFYARQDFKTPNAVQVVFNLAFIAWLLIFEIKKGRAGGQDAIIGYFILVISQAVAACAMYCWQNRGDALQMPGSADILRIARYGSLVLLNNILFFLLYRADYWLLNYFRSSEELGNYIQVSKLGQVFMVLPGLLATVIFPLTARGNEPDLARRLPLLGRSMFSAYFMVILGIALTGWFLFPFLYGAEFSGMYVPFLWLSPGLLALSLHALLTAYFAGRNKVIVNFIGSFAGLLVIVVADLILIPLYGNAGAAIGSSLGYFAYAAVVFARFNKEEKISYKDFLFMKAGDITRLKNEFIGNK